VRLPRPPLRSLAAAVAGALAVGGCADAGARPAGPPPPATAPGPASPGTLTGPVTVRLRHLPAGIAVVGLDADTRHLDVEVRMVGLVPGSSHAAALREGDCARPGAVLHPLQAMVADARGVADVRSRVGGVAESEIPAGGWQLTVDAAAPSVPLACGEVTNTANATAVSAGLGPVDPPGSPDRDAAGTATLEVAGGGLTVTLDVTGLVPGSRHAADIRAGTCESEAAGVVHVLPPLTADATGHALATTRVPGVPAIPAGVWYVEVPRTGAAPGAIAPLVCGNVGP
jgi:hypothetical protein